MGISACLAGKKVRYDGRHKFDPFLIETFGRFVDYVPVCPEVSCGLPVPREPMRLEGEDPAGPRLITVATRVDMTGRMELWAEKCMEQLENEDLSGFIFKSRSPSSGMSKVPVYNGQGKIAGQAAGLFAKAFMDRFPSVPVTEEENLHDPEQRENFVERIFVLKRWRAVSVERRQAALIDFHATHKYILLSHSALHLSGMGRLLGTAKEVYPDELYSRYESMLIKALLLKATVTKHVNVLQHIAGYFKKCFSSDEKHEISEIIDSYKESKVPLIVPISCLNHYVRKYGQPYLSRQAYLNPHPIEVQMRYHA